MVRCTVKVKKVVCEVCFRRFRIKGGKKRYKCLEEWSKPEKVLQGRRKISVLSKVTYRRNAGVAIHTCRGEG